MISLRRLKNKTRFVFKLSLLSIGIGYGRIRTNLSPTQAMTAQKSELTNIVRQSNTKPIDIKLLGFRNSDVNNGIIFVKGNSPTPKPNTPTAKPGLGKTPRGRISMPRKPARTPRAPLKRGFARGESFTLGGQTSRLPTRVSTSLGTQLNDRNHLVQPELPGGNDPSGNSNEFEEELECSKKSKKKNSIDHEVTREPKKKTQENDEEFSNTSDDEQETDTETADETADETETAHDKAIKFLEANSNRQLTDQEIEEQYYLFMEECKQRNINVVASVERFKELVTERGKVYPDNVYEGRTALFAEGLGWCKDIRRCSDLTLDIDFEYTTDTGQIGLFDAKVGRDISYIPGSQFWKNPPTHQEMFTKIGEKLMIQKQRVKQYDSAEYGTEVLHVVSLERIKSMPERIHLKQDVLDGVRQQGAREMQNGAMTNDELTKAIDTTKFINYK